VDFFFIKRVFFDIRIKKLINFNSKIHNPKEIKQFKEVFAQTITFKLQNSSKEIEHIKVRFPHAIASVLNVAQNQVLNLQKMLESNNPKLKSKSGFAQISKEKKVIDISELNINDNFELQSDEVYINAVVTHKELK